jgi:hypothetical protein
MVAPPARELGFPDCQSCRAAAWDCSREDAGRKDFRQFIERLGFALSAHEPKFESAPVLQVEGLSCRLLAVSKILRVALQA